MGKIDSSQKNSPHRQRDRVRQISIETTVEIMGGVVKQFAANCLEQLADNEAEIAAHEEAIARLKNRNGKLKEQLARAQELLKQPED